MTKYLAIAIRTHMHTLGGLHHNIIHTQAYLLDPTLLCPPEGYSRG